MSPVTNSKKSSTLLYLRWDGVESDAAITHTKSLMHMEVKRRDADEQEWKCKIWNIYIYWLFFTNWTQNLFSPESEGDQTSSNTFSSFSCACRGAPLWCQGCEGGERWFPAERRFTIDRQGRAECNSIGDYSATWKTRAARGNLWSGVMIYGKRSFVAPVCTGKKKKKGNERKEKRKKEKKRERKIKMQGETRWKWNVSSWHNWR